MKECCVQCGNETIYNFTDHIDTRYGYVEGVGQYCSECFNKKARTIQVPINVIKETPNDQELARKVRKIFWDSGEQ